ncbi:carbohydrate ABC transporter permease, partial [Rhizobium phaseoli]
MTDMSSSIRMRTSTRIYLYVSLSLIAATVLIPLLTTALGGFKTLGDLRTNPFGLPT